MARAVVGLLVLGLGLSGCSTTPADDVPALVSRLERVDEAAVANDPERLESAVAALLQAVDDAEGAGDLEADDVSQIRAAAEALLVAGAPREPANTGEQTTTPPDVGDEEDRDPEEDGVEEEPDDEADSPPPPPGPGKEKSPGKGKGKGNEPGKGKGKGDDD